MAQITLAISGILAIVFGILVLAWPKFLRYAVGIYLLIIGFLQILDSSDVFFSPI